LARRLSDAISDSDARLTPIADESSMATHAIVREENACTKMAGEMIENRSILRSKLQRDAIAQGSEAMIIRNSIDSAVEFARIVKAIIEKDIQND
jgi:hypothetical protein